MEAAVHPAALGCGTLCVAVSVHARAPRTALTLKPLLRWSARRLRDRLRGKNIGRKRTLLKLLRIMGLRREEHRRSGLGPERRRRREGVDGPALRDSKRVPGLVERVRVAGRGVEVHVRERHDQDFLPRDERRHGINLRRNGMHRLAVGRQHALPLRFGVRSRSCDRGVGRHERLLLLDKLLVLLLLLLDRLRLLVQLLVDRLLLLIDRLLRMPILLLLLKRLLLDGLRLRLLLGRIEVLLDPIRERQLHVRGRGHERSDVRHHRTRTRSDRSVRGNGE